MKIINKIAIVYSATRKTDEALVKVREIIDSLNKIKWRKDKKGYTVPNDELIKKILPESKNLQFDFRKLCLERVINSI